MTKKLFIINGHQKWEISPSRLNRTLVDYANEILSAKGYEVHNKEEG